MAINFPHSPSVNDTHTHSGKEWTWNGTSWILSTNASNYTLPIATAGALGGIKVGSRLTIDSSTGVLSADVQGGGGTSTTINNNADNRLITGSGTANTLEAESDLTFDPSSNRLSIGENGTDAYLEVGTGAPGTAGSNRFQIRSNNSSNYLYSYADSMFHISVAKASGGGTIQLDSISSTMAQFVRGAECSLYHSGTKRIETTSDGIKISGGIQDKDGQLGTSGQILSSTGTELDWIDAPSGGGGGGSGSGGSILQLIQETGPSGQISAVSGQGSSAAWIDVIDKDITITAGADKRVKIEVNGEPKLDGFRTMRYEIRLIRTTGGTATTLYEGFQGLADSSDNYSTMNGVLYLDTPGAGTHNYKYQFRQVVSWNSSTAKVEADSMVMLLTEIDLSAGSSGGASVTSSDTAPTNPTAGDIWFKTDELALKIYYNDGDSNQWVDAIAPAMASGGGGGVPTGTIAMWSGAANAIPTGWTVCDGTNGTPDLRDRFVVGAGTLYSVDATGGSADAVVVEHSHTTNIDGGHVIPGNGGSSFPYGGAGTYSSTIFSMDDEGVSGTNANLPPYYALCYIMCVSGGSGGGGSSITSATTNGTNALTTTTTTSGSNVNAIEIQTDNGTASAVRWRFTPPGHFIPNVNAAYDIGNAEYKVRHLFLSDNSLKFVDDNNVEHSLSVNSNKLHYEGKEVLANCVFTGLDNNQTIKYNGTNWVNEPFPSAFDGTLAGDLTVDTNVLKVDTAQNQVGIGTATPNSLLHLYQPTDAVYITFGQGQHNINYWVGTYGTTAGFFIEQGSSNNSLLTADASDYVSLYGAGTKRIETTSTGVTITGDLSVTGSAGGVVDSRINVASATSNQLLSWTGTAYDWIDPPTPAAPAFQSNWRIPL